MFSVPVFVISDDRSPSLLKQCKACTPTGLLSISSILSHLLTHARVCACVCVCDHVHGIRKGVAGKGSMSPYMAKAHAGGTLVPCMKNSLCPFYIVTNTWPTKAPPPPTIITHNNQNTHQHQKKKNIHIYTTGGRKRTNNSKTYQPKKKGKHTQTEKINYRNVASTAAASWSTSEIQSGDPEARLL